MITTDDHPARPARRRPVLTLDCSGGTPCLRLRASDGQAHCIHTLDGLVMFAREHLIPDTGLAASITALGTALHCTLHAQRGMAASLAEATIALRGLARKQVLWRMELCAMRYHGQLTAREIARLLTMEAHRIVRDESLPHKAEPSPVLRTLSALA